jgi:hypothetical protein
MSVSERGPYVGICAMLAERRCVILDGGVGTELPDAREAPTGLDDRIGGRRSPPMSNG